MKKLRVAVSGLGRIGWKFHLPAIAADKRFELAAVFDPDIGRLEEAKAKYEVKGYSDYTDMLSGEQLDLMVVASPTLYHFDQIISAFEHNIDVFAEKPLAVSLKQTDTIIESMLKHKRKLMVYQPWRATQEFQALEYLLSRKLIGQIYMIRSSISRFERRNDWQTLRKNGGGMLNNYGAHLLDQMLKLSGSRVNRISCCMKSIVCAGDADDVVNALMETENGIILDLDINMASAYELPRWYILGSLGSIKLETLESGEDQFAVRYLIPEELQKLELKPELAAEGRKYGNSDSLMWHEEVLKPSEFMKIDFYEKCYEYFAMDKESFVPVDETRELMRVMEGCRRDAGW